MRTYFMSYLAICSVPGHPHRSVAKIHVMCQSLSIFNSISIHSIARIELI